jgi:hypothetical protein
VAWPTAIGRVKIGSARDTESVVEEEEEEEEEEAVAEEEEEKKEERGGEECLRDPEE